VQPGELIDHYRLVSLVGAGGMGEVYRAIDERLQRDVAIKVLPQSTGPAHREARLLREAQAASHLNHPGIVTIHDVGRWGDRTYIVMELVDGRRLSELAQTGIGAPHAVALCRQAAEAMAVAHERGILHRDIKPDNLMVTRDDRVKILDFGVAKVYDPGASIDMEPVEPVEPPVGPVGPVGPEDDTAPAAPSPLAEIPTGQALDDTFALHPSTPGTISVTKTGALLGTPAYMSPEQAAGAPVDERSEVYSLGLVLYELLTGLRPLQRDTLFDTLSAAREPSLALPSAAARGREVPRGCDRLLTRALARAPADRHPSMRALADDLRALEASLTVRPRRRRWLPVAAALTLGAGGATALVVALGGGADGPERPAGAPPIETNVVRRLTFDPGCEELPSFWPDGGSVVFDAIVDGDTELVRLDLASGTRQRLTRSPGWDIAATVSPDGRSIAFIRFTERGRELMVMPVAADGTPGEARSLGMTRGYPNWSRSGHVLAGDDVSGVRRFDPAGGRPGELIISASGFIAIEIEEMAGGELLLSLRHAAQDPGRVALGVVRDGKLDLPGGSPPLDASGIERDPSGRGFYFGEMTASGPRLYWRALAGGPREELARMPFPHGGMGVDPSGGRLVVSTCRQLFQVGRIEDGRFSPLFPGRDWSDTNLAAVGDGSFVFSSDRSGVNEIWIGRPGEQPRPLISEPSTSPAVSADRRQLAWVATTPERRGIFLSGIDGSAARQLTRNDTDDQPTFSSDGTAVYFMRAGPDGPRVFRIPAGGGDAAPVTEGGVVAFAVSPIGERMAWVRQAPRGRQVALGAPGGESSLIESLSSGNYTEVAFSTDGETLWVGRGANELLQLRGDGTGEPTVVWRTTNDLVGFISADAGGLIADVATYDGDVYLVEGRFR
jgi:serine/threonine protein kinase